ncbi:hypothetical protein [Pseudanabaena yagii]|uniref:Uncharacterized protein n=1 Tax=Pseudanabaena yagii GIHE-NHR1 TaxID=2722753 RepID=A0ABX1LST2_9CYAN|nr:hypothetical protein [Pseudanabaena yagii]NMF59213.1 hypothetical protein [Pseudanabaena yagii GIHE-NHR1]
MSKVLISSLIDEINTLLSRPVGSVSRKASPDTIHQREQLKQLRSHLEGLTDDSQLGNLDKQCQALVTRLQKSHTDIDSPTSNPQSARTDKLETLPTLLVSPVVSNSFGAESDLIQETSTMTNGTPESNSFVNDRMIAALQQAIQQTLQQVVKESVQLSVQQVVSQTFAVERALMVGEISASINKLVESQQRSQISQELITLNQQKQKLSAEISQLESDRAAWMQQFQEFQASQQESLDHSLRSVKTYLQDQIRDQITDTVQQTVTGTVNQTVAQTLQETLQDNLGSLPSATNPDIDSQREQEFADKVQEQTDRFLLHLDQMFSSTFRSLEQDIQEYQNSIEAKLGHIETLEQKGEALINALVDRISQQKENPVEQIAPETILPELPDDIPPQYLETAAEPADENLINALLAGNEFGEPIVEPVEAQVIEVSPLDIVLSQDEVVHEDINHEDSNIEALDSLLEQEDSAENEIANDSSINSSDDDDSEITEIEVVLGAPSDTLFEIPDVSTTSESLSEALGDIENLDLDTSAISDHQSALNALHLNPDFDVEAETQLVETFDQQGNRGTEIDEIDLQALNTSSALASEAGQTIDEPAELLQWLDETSNRPNSATNIAEVSADQDLLSWLGNDALDMAKLPMQPPPTQPSIPTNSISDLAILNDSAIDSLDSQGVPHEMPENDILDHGIENGIDQFFHNSFSDQASDSEESLILLTNKTVSNVEFPEWEDSLVNELSSDLERLDAGLGADLNIANSLDQFIRNTPYSATNWQTDESHAYPTIIDVSAKASSSPTQQSLTDVSEIPDIIDNPDDLFAAEALGNTQDNLPFNRLSEKSEIVIDPALQSSPFSNDSSEIPEIFDDPESLFSQTSEEDQSQGEKSSANDEDMDAIFADIIAETAAKYAPPTPFESNDEIDALFQATGQANQTESSSNVHSETDVSTSSQGFVDRNRDKLDESRLDTLLFGFDPDTEIEHVFINQFERSDISSGSQPPTNKNDARIQELNEIDTVMQEWQRDEYAEIDVGAVTMQGSFDFAEPIEVVEELDTILQGFAGTETSDLTGSSEETNFAPIEDMATVLEDPIGNVTQDDEWSAALEALEAKLTQPIAYDRKPEVGELSADEFFASLENSKLNVFANEIEESPLSPDWDSTSSTGASLEDLVSDAEDDSDDLLLNEFADTQDQVVENDWDNLLHDLNAFNFREPLLDDRREQLGLSSVAPITDSLDNVLDIDSLVVESRSAALIPPPSEKEVYSLDDTWVIGIDFGSTALRTSLLNANTGKVYSLYLDDVDELPCRLVWTEDHSLDDPITKDIRVLLKKSQISDLENGEVAITHFKQFLKLGLPYRGVSTWQPIIQWSDSHQANLRWLIAALKNLIEQIQTRANHPKLPDLGLILLKLSGVVFGYPASWSDTYVLNIRESILKSGLVAQPEQVMAVDQAIAPVLALIHEQKTSQEITLLIDAGAVTTSLCLIKGSLDRKTSDRSKLHIRSLDYAGNSLSQDIIVQLFYPHWQLITNPNRHLCKFDHLTLPEVATESPQQRIPLQQYLLGSNVGQQMLELADRLKVTFGQDISVDSWNEDLLGQPIVVLRREVENLILQPFIQRINRELNAIISNAGILGEDVRQVLLLGNTMNIPLLSRWLAQKLPNAKIDPLGASVVANGLAVAPLYANLHDVARQQYSDYFLLQEICRLNLTQSVNPNQLLKQLQMRGVNIKACRDRILSILQGDLPEGIFPWQEPEHGAVLEDPTLSSDLFAGRLFELETDGTYQPNVTKFQQLRVYLQAIIGNMSQTLNEPLVFPEVKV